MFTFCLALQHCGVRVEMKSIFRSKNRRRRGRLLLVLFSGGQECIDWLTCYSFSRPFATAPLKRNDFRSTGCCILHVQRYRRSLTRPRYSRESSRKVDQTKILRSCRYYTEIFTILISGCKNASMQKCTKHSPCYVSRMNYSLLLLVLIYYW